VARASWNFVIWGALHGGVLVAERLWQRARPAAWPALPAWAGTVITFHIVALGWIFFRCTEFSGAIAFCAASRRAGAGAAGQRLGAGADRAGHGLPLARAMRAALGPRAGVLPGWAVGLIGTLVLPWSKACAAGGIAPFIYFQF
jgi:hypothetical protein